MSHKRDSLYFKRETPESPFCVIEKLEFDNGLGDTEHTGFFDRTLYFSHNRDYLSATAEHKAHTLE